MVHVRLDARRAIHSDERKRSMISMKDKTIDRAFFTQTLWDHCADYFEEVDVREDYSGRGMYGKNCVGVTFSGNIIGFTALLSIGMMAALIIDHDMDGDAAQAAIATLMRSARSDNVGYDSIVYWPGWNLIDMSGA